MPAGFVGAVIATSIVAIELVGAPTAARSAAAPVEPIAVTPTDASADPPTGGDPLASTTIRPRVSDDGDVVVFDVLPDVAEPTASTDSDPTVSSGSSEDERPAATDAAPSDAEPTAATDAATSDAVSSATSDADRSASTATSPTGTSAAESSDTSAAPAVPDEEVAGIRAVVRVRSADSTEPVPDEGGSRPAVSGDGCTVTWSRVVAGQAGGPVTEVRLLDRCATPPVSAVTVLSGPGDAPLPPAALSVDGSVVVVSTGVELVRLERDQEGTHAETGRIVPAFDEPAVVGETFDVSDDGSIIVFEAGPGTTPFEPESSAVVRARAGVQQVVADGARHPSVSGDGTLAAFESLGGEGGPGIVLARWSDAGDPVDPPVVDPVVAEGTLPALDPSGRHLVHVSADGMRLVTWVGVTGEPFSDTIVTDLSDPVVGDDPILPASGPVVSRGARTVVFDTADGAALTTDPRFADGIGVWARIVPVDGGGDLVDLGSGAIGDRLAAEVTVTNDGPASLAVADGGVTVDPPFVVESTSCSGLVVAGGSCTVSVSVTVQALGNLPGEVVVTGSGPTPGSLTAPVTAFGVAATTTTTTVVSTFPPPVRPLPTVRPTVRPTTTTTVVVPLAFSPSSFEFAPTIVVDGRRRAAIELRNPGSLATTVLDVAIVDDATGAYSIAATTCGGTLVAGAGCTIEVDFAPTVEGVAGATLLATEDDGRSTSIALSGVGAPPPSITVIPGVAGPGQVVTVRGSGFPAGAVVELWWADGLVTADVAVGEAGAFDEPIVVLPNTLTGPVPIVVLGQVDLFGDVVGEMIVAGAGSRSNPAVRGGFGPHVSR